MGQLVASEPPQTRTQISRATIPNQDEQGGQHRPEHAVGRSSERAVPDFGLGRGGDGQGMTDYDPGIEQPNRMPTLVYLILGCVDLLAVVFMA